ncbi:MAG: M14 family zinc carboxypeptidase [Gemmatimonadota bacterium]
MTRANIAARRSALVAARIMIVMAVLAISLTALPSGISAQGRTPEVAGRSSVQVPSPAEVLGYEIGERFTPVSGIERYLRTLADSSELVSLDTYGETVEGRPLLQAVVALPRYRARMDEILAANRELIDPDTPEERAREIAAENPAVIYLTYGIHGNESSSSEAALWTAFDLASGAPGVAGVLDSLVVVIDPAANPDGRDRYVNFFRQASLARPNPSPDLRERQEPWPGGRFNHYLFDLNRDWAWLTQLESRARLDRFLRYNPQVHVDFHEMGYASSYFFFPAADPVNDIFPDHILDWGARFGAGNARAMDAEGLLYYTGQVFDLFYPGYGDSWPSLMGAVGMTYEQGGGGRAGLLVERPDGTLLTLRERALGHRTTASATLRTAAAGRSDLLLGFAAIHREVDAGLDDVLLVPGSDAGRLDALVKLLRIQEVEVERATAEFQASATLHPGFDARDVFPPGTLRIPARQPRGRLAAALLRPENEFEAETTYDITAWALPYAYGVEAHSISGATGGDWVPWDADGPGPEPMSSLARGSYGYLLAPSFAHARALVDFLEEGGRAVSLSESFTLDGTAFPRGTLFFPRGRNEGLDARLATAGLEGAVVPIATGRVTEGPDLGTNDAAPISLPSIALVGGEGSSATSYGAHWYFLERILDVPFDALEHDRVGSVDLAEYDVLVVPEGSPVSAIDASGMDRIEAWVRDGGTLLAVGSAARDLAPRFDVEERTEPPGEGEVDEEEERLVQALRTREERELESRLDRVPGTILKTSLDPGHPLGFGAAAATYDDQIFVLSTGRAFEPEEHFSSVAYFPEGVDKVAGVVRERHLERMDRSAWLVEVGVGSGKVILFADDPLFRLFWYSGWQLWTNGILLGPAF